MSSLASLDSANLRVLRGRLEEDDRVERAMLDEERDSIWIIMPPDGDEAVVRSRIGGLLEEFGIPADGVRVQVAAMSASAPRRRVRFIGASRQEMRDGHVRIDAELEWEGARLRGSAEGESGALIELRTAGQAALRAVERLTNDEVKLRLIGVKQIRAFDTELVVASLVRSEGEVQRYVGSVLASSDPPRAACLAVLNALNRMLGNFLKTDS